MARAASAVPTMVPAPGLFSITIGLPRSLLMKSASRRATISAPPPGANGTMILIRFSGKPAYDCSVTITIAVNHINNIDTNAEVFVAIDVRIMRARRARIRPSKVSSKSKQPGGPTADDGLSLLDDLIPKPAAKRSRILRQGLPFPPLDDEGLADCEVCS